VDEPVARWINPDLLEEMCEDSVCALCLGVMLEPASGSGHVWHSFCRPCYVEALRDRTQCPTCLQPVSGEMVRHRHLEGMLLQLRLRCEHAECAWRGCVGQLAAHLGECEWEPANCLNAGCADSPLPKDVREIIECPNEGCSEQRERGSMHVHRPDSGQGEEDDDMETQSDLSSLLSRDGHEEGCDARLLREDMAAHAEATVHLDAEATHLDSAVELEAIHLDSEVELLQSAWSQNFALEGSGTELERESLIEGKTKCRVHITLSILDKHGKILREVHKLGTATEPAEEDFTVFPHWAGAFTPTAVEKAQSVRADGSIRLRAEVRLFLD